MKLIWLTHLLIIGAVILCIHIGMSESRQYPSAGLAGSLRFTNCFNGGYYSERLRNCVAIRRNQYRNLGK